MGIKLEIDGQVTDIKKDNFSEAMQRLENRLKVETPVMFQNFSSSTLPYVGGRTTEIKLWNLTASALADFAASISFLAVSGEPL